MIHFSRYPALFHLFDRANGHRVPLVALGELGIHVGVPIEHADQIVEIVMELGQHVLGQQAPIDDAALDFRLEHREHIAVDLGLIGHQRTGSVQDAGIDLPSAAGFETVSAGVEKNSVVSAVPVLKAAVDIFFCGSGLEAHVGVGKVIAELVVLRREVVGFGLALLSDQLGELVALMHVMRNRAHVVEELAEQVPAAFALHDIGAEQKIAGAFDCIFQQEFAARVGMNIAEAFVRRGRRAIRGFRRRGEPALVDPAPVRAEGIDVIGMKLQPASGNHEGTRHPGWL